MPKRDYLGGWLVTRVQNSEEILYNIFCIMGKWSQKTVDRPGRPTVLFLGCVLALPLSQWHVFSKTSRWTRTSILEYANENELLRLPPLIY